VLGLVFLCAFWFLLCSAMLSCGVCLSVCHVHVFFRMNKHIFKILSPSGSHTILVLPCQTLWQYSDKDPVTGAKIEIFDRYLALASITARPSMVKLSYST